MSFHRLITRFTRASAPEVPSVVTEPVMRFAHWVANHFPVIPFNLMERVGGIASEKLTTGLLYLLAVLTLGKIVVYAFARLSPWLETATMTLALILLAMHAVPKLVRWLVPYVFAAVPREAMEASQNNGMPPSNMLRDALKCLICNEVVPTPILQCRQGHIYCEFCLEDMREESNDLKCPSCSLDMNEPIFNRIIEMAVSNMLFTCRYPACQERVKHSELSDHIKGCEHRPIKYTHIYSCDPTVLRNALENPNTVFRSNPHLLTNGDRNVQVCYQLTYVPAEHSFCFKLLELGSSPSENKWFFKVSTDVYEHSRFKMQAQLCMAMHDSDVGAINMNNCMLVWKDEIAHVMDDFPAPVKVTVSSIIVAE